MINYFIKRFSVKLPVFDMFAQSLQPLSSFIRALFALPLGYPAMTLGDHLVHGFLLTFADQLILETLDNLESYEPSRPQSENHYNRSLIEIYTINERSQCTAYAYLMELKQVNFLNGVFLESGNWNE